MDDCDWGIDWSEVPYPRDYEGGGDFRMTRTIEGHIHPTTRRVVEEEVGEWDSRNSRSFSRKGV